MDGREFALLTVDFVDQAALYAFQSQERIRKDPTAFCRMESLPRRDYSSGGYAAGASMHMSKPEFDVSTRVYEQLKANMDQWTETTQRNIVAGVRSEARCPM